MSWHPERRWLGGTIPIVFHWVLAAHLFALGQFRAREVPSTPGRVATLRR